jgi:hypothetical protein
MNFEKYIQKSMKNQEIKLKQKKKRKKNKPGE